jgi:response regulator RpfG family c-di-GMP phosphodiesterase
MGYLDDINKLLGQKPELDSAKKDDTKPLVKVLIIEDEESLREMYSEKFKHEGFEVITAKEGKEGLETAIKYDPDIILLDLMMPVMDGKKMLRELRKIPKFKNLPVVVLTNAGDIDSIKETVHYEHANEFFIKSNVSMDDVVKKVKSWTSWGPNR